MKKLIISLIAIFVTFTSFSQTAKDTTYLKHKNINYMIVKIWENGKVSRDVKNIDVKYEGDEATRKNYNHKGDTNLDITAYYAHNREKADKDVMEIYLNYIKENFSIEMKKSLLDALKNGEFYFVYKIVIEINGTYVDATWSDRNNFFKDEDIANIDMLIRKKMVFKPSGLPTQHSMVHAVYYDRKQCIEFLENEIRNHQ